jgi:protein-L-isoaspartate(D-aspartate) O-methyltransferase
MRDGPSKCLHRLTCIGSGGGGGVWIWSAHMPILKDKTMADYALQRRNMVESQVRPSDITDRRIIRAMGEIAREAFCPEAMQTTSYRDEMLQVNTGRGARGRFTPAPRTLAKMIQALDLGDHDTVLEIGTGTGYAAAILSRIAAKVVCVEPDPALAEAARANVAAMGAANVTVVAGDSPAGHARGAPYDAILIAASVATMPRALLDQLKDGGRLVAILADGSFGRLTQWRRIGGTFDSLALSDAGAAPLAGFEKPAAFVF